MDDEGIAICLLRSLPKTYEHVMLHRETSNVKLRTQRVTQALTNEHVKCTSIAKESKSGNDAKAFNTDSEVRKCNKCGRAGHLATKCWGIGAKKPGQKPKFGGGFRKDNQVERKQDHFAIAFATSMECGTSPTVPTAGKWAIESGATHHICNDLSAFDKLQKKEQGDLIVANGAKSTILGVGSVEEPAILPNGLTIRLTIENVLYVPTVDKNLLSIPQLNKSKKFRVVFGNDCMEVHDKQFGVVVAAADMVDCLYWLRLASPKSTNLRLCTHVQVMRQPECYAR